MLRNPNSVTATSSEQILHHAQQLFVGQTFEKYADRITRTGYPAEVIPLTIGYEANQLPPQLIYMASKPEPGATDIQEWQNWCETDGGPKIEGQALKIIDGERTIWLIYTYTPTDRRPQFQLHTQSARGIEFVRATFLPTITSEEYLLSASKLAELWKTPAVYEIMDVIANVAQPSYDGRWHDWRMYMRDGFFFSPDPNDKISLAEAKRVYRQLVHESFDEPSASFVDVCYGRVSVDGKIVILIDPEEFSHLDSEIIGNAPALNLSNSDGSRRATIGVIASRDANTCYAVIHVFENGQQIPSKVMKLDMRTEDWSRALTSLYDEVIKYLKSDLNTE